LVVASTRDGLKKAIKPQAAKKTKPTGMPKNGKLLCPEEFPGEASGKNSETALSLGRHFDRSIRRGVGKVGRRKGAFVQTKLREKGNWTCPGNLSGNNVRTGAAKKGEMMRVLSPQVPGAEDMQKNYGKSSRESCRLMSGRAKKKERSLIGDLKGSEIILLSHRSFEGNDESK